MVGFSAALFLSGCVQYKYTPLTDAQVIHFADRAVTTAGIPLADFEPVPVLARQGERWSVVYQAKVPSANRDGLHVSVDNLTGAAQVLPGNHGQRASDHRPNLASRPGWPPPILGSASR